MSSGTGRIALFPHLIHHLLRFRREFLTSQRPPMDPDHASDGVHGLSRSFRAADRKQALPQTEGFTGGGILAMPAARHECKTRT